MPQHKAPSPALRELITIACVIVILLSMLALLHTCTNVTQG